MKRFVTILAVMVMACSLAFATGGTKGKGKTDKQATTKAEKTTLTGYIVDKMCASGHEADLGTMAPTHEKSCALSESCIKSGLGLAVDGKWYAFDAKGSARAAALLKKSKVDKGATYEVTGTIDGDTLTVASIKEVAAKAGATT